MGPSDAALHCQHIFRLLHINKLSNYHLSIIKVKKEQQQKHTEQIACSGGRRANFEASSFKQLPWPNV
jgi:hypothetical protein